MATQEQYNVLNQPILEKHIKVEIYDINNNKLDELEGYATDGTITIDASSNIRRQCSNITFVVANDKFVPSPSSYFWLNKKMRLSVGIRDLITSNIVWFHMGWYYIDRPDLKESQTERTLSISGLDYMCRLDGTFGGYLSNAVATEISPNTPISDAIRSNVQQLGLENNFIIDDIKDLNGNLLKTTYTLDEDCTKTVYDLIKDLANMYMGWEFFYSAGTEISQPVFTFQAVKNRINDPVVWDFSQTKVLIDLDNQPNFGNVANDIWVWGATNTGLSSSSPEITTLTATTGSLTAGTYYYMVSAILPSGETVPSLEQSCKLTSTGGVSIAWKSVTGATGYKVYGRTQNSEKLIINTTGTSFNDNGTMPLSNVSPNVQAQAHVQNIDVSSPFSIPNIGKRSLVINNSQYFTNEQCLSCANYQLWLHSNLCEQIQVSTIPLYILDVNQIVKFSNPQIGIEGKYITRKIDYSLKQDGVSSISCSKLYPYSNIV